QLPLGHEDVAAGIVNATGAAFGPHAHVPFPFGQDGQPLPPFAPQNPAPQLKPFVTLTGFAAGGGQRFVTANAGGHLLVTSKVGEAPAMTATRRNITRPLLAVSPRHRSGSSSNRAGRRARTGPSPATSSG